MNRREFIKKLTVLIGVSFLNPIELINSVSNLPKSEMSLYEKEMNKILKQHAVEMEHLFLFGDYKL